MNYGKFPIDFNIRIERPDCIGTYVYTRFYENKGEYKLIGHIYSIKHEISVDNSFVKIWAKVTKNTKKGLRFDDCAYDPDKWGTRKGIKELMNFQQHFILPAYRDYHITNRTLKDLEIDLDEWINSEKISHRWMAIASKKLTFDQLSTLLVDSDDTIRKLAQGRMKFKLYRRAR